MVDRDTKFASPAGSVLLLVLVAIIIMSLATGTYLVLMHNEYVATHYSGHHQQMRLLTESGIEYLRLNLAQSELLLNQQGGIQNNPNVMQGVLVADDAAADFRGRFTVLVPDMLQGQYSSIRYGLENESARLNLNTLVAAGGDGEEDGAGEDDELRDRLMALPGMTESVADAILDWLDEDDQPRQFGAEQSDYLARDPPYVPRNGPLTSLDELLLVRGVTPELLYGLDSNRNYVVDANEVARGALTSMANINGLMNRGWNAYLTLYGIERLESPEGERRINVNSNNLQQLHSDLSETVGESAAKFIIAYRQFGAAEQEASPQTADLSSLEIDLEKQAAHEIPSLLDLVAVNVSVQQDENSPAVNVASPWPDDSATYRQSLLELMDRVTTQRGRRIAGRVNINEASRPVLMSIPGMTGLSADQIISRRNLDVDRLTGTQRHAIWMLAEGIVTLEEMKQLDPYVTTGGDVFRCQVVGYFQAVPSQARVEVVLDSSRRTTRIVSWQDLAPLGPGFAHHVLGTEIVATE